MTSYIDLLAAHDKLQVELDFARHERNIMAGEVKKLASQVMTLTELLWRERPGVHRGDPCIFCGMPHGDVAIWECTGTTVGKVGQSYMTLNADSDLPPETADALAKIGELVVEQDAEDIDWFNAPIEQVDAELRKFGFNPEQVGKTGARIAAGWLEAQRQKMRAEAAEAQVEMLKASFWIAHHGFHLGDPCMFCGVAHDEVLPGECDGHLVQLDAAPFMYKRME